MHAIQKLSFSNLVPGVATPAWQLRLWCAPEVILMVTNFADEQTLLLEAIKQARRSTAKILLVYVARPGAARRMGAHAAQPGRPHSTAHEAQVMLERMTRQLRWAGIPSEPVLLQGLPAEEVPQLVQLRGVNRVIVTTQPDPRASGIGGRAIAEQILPRVTVPVCIVGGRGSAPTPFETSHGKVLLAIRAGIQCDLLLEFACRFAKEQRAALTVMYEAGRATAGANQRNAIHTVPVERDPLWQLRTAQTSFPFTMELVESDLIARVLEHAGEQQQDFILMGAESTAWDEQMDGMGNVVRLAHASPCPLLILGSAAGKPAHEKALAAEQRTEATDTSVAMGTDLHGSERGAMLRPAQKNHSPYSGRVGVV
jgi:nucleotide-binding universal stress UspA family protein